MLQYSASTFKNVLDILEYEGYITITKGGDFKYHEHVDSEGVVWQIADGRKSSILEINQCMIDLVEEIKVDKNKANYNMLILRDEEKNDVPYEMTEVLKAQKKLLLAYNEFLDDNVFKDKNGDVINEPFLKRIYTRDWEHGGRFYMDRGVVQNMHQTDRVKITINNEPVSEVDIQSCHPSIAYTLAGEDMDVDPYDFKLDCKINYEEIENFKKEFNLPCYDPIRNIKKKITLLAFTTDPHKLAFAVSKKLGDDKFLQVSKDPEKRKLSEFIGLSFVQVANGINNMKDHNHKIMFMFNKGCYQNHEGKLMHNILNYCLQESIIVIPIHDSVVCQESKIEIVKSIMVQAFKDTFGDNRNLKLKVRKNYEQSA